MKCLAKGTPEILSSDPYEVYLVNLTSLKRLSVQIIEVAKFNVWLSEVMSSFVIVLYAKCKGAGWQQTNVHGLSFAGEVQLVLYRNLDWRKCKTIYLQQMVDDYLFKSVFGKNAKTKFFTVLPDYKYQIVMMLDRCGASFSWITIRYL